MRERKGKSERDNLCCDGVCVHVCRWAHSLTSSLRSDPGLCMYHRIWACWDLGIHSRKVELLCTPKRTLSSTRPPTRPIKKTWLSLILFSASKKRYIMQVSSSDHLSDSFICSLDVCLQLAKKHRLSYRDRYRLNFFREQSLRTLFCVPALAGRVSVLDVLSSGTPGEQTHSYQD